MQVVNVIKPKEMVINNKNPNDSALYIDFTKYANWTKSTKFKDFTNFYKDDKHIRKTFFTILTKLFPVAQSNISEIMANQQPHCHLLEDEKYESAIEAIKNIHGFQLGDSIELWQLGTVGAARVIGPILSNENTYTFYPMLIDCNHMLYSSSRGSNNHADVKKYKRCGGK